MTTIALETDDERRKRLAREGTARYRAAHPELMKTARKNRYTKEAATTAKRRADPKTWANIALVGIRWRAKNKGLEFSITPANVVVPPRCPVLGISISSAKGTPYDNRPSIDRFDNSKGYTPDNIRVISNRANALKKDATVEEIRLLLVYMEGSL